MAKGFSQDPETLPEVSVQGIFQKESLHWKHLPWREGLPSSWWQATKKQWHVSKLVAPKILLNRFPIQNVQLRWAPSSCMEGENSTYVGVITPVTNYVRPFIGVKEFHWQRTVRGPPCRHRLQHFLLTFHISEHIFVVFGPHLAVSVPHHHQSTVVVVVTPT